MEINKNNLFRNQNKFFGTDGLAPATTAFDGAKTGMENDLKKQQQHFSVFVSSAIDLYHAQQLMEGKMKRQSAHNSGHVCRVAYYAADYALQNPNNYDVDKNKVAKTAVMAGLFHDLIRNPVEVEEGSKIRGDGYVTADLVRFLKNLGDAKEAVSQKAKVPLYEQGKFTGKFLLIDAPVEYENGKCKVKGKLEVKLNKKQTELGEPIPSQEQKPDQIKTNYEVSLDGKNINYSLISAQDFEVAYYLMKQDEKIDTSLNSMVNFMKSIPKTEIEDIAQAIEANELKDVATIKAQYEKWKSEGRIDKVLLQEALTYGDKGKEGVGPSVVVRRFQFVSGERYENKEDIGKFAEKLQGFKEDEKRMLAFIMESMIRMYSNKAVSDFPDNSLWKEVAESRTAEEKIYACLLKYFHNKFEYSEEDLFNLAFENEFPKFKASADKIKANMKGLMPNSDIIKRIGDEEVYNVWNFGLALAYSQSLKEDAEELSKTKMKSVSDKTLLSYLEMADSKTLKEKLERIMES